MKKQLFIFVLALLMVCSSFTACGKDADLQGVIMKTQPTKTEYFVGEMFDPAGATVELTYSNGTTETKGLTLEMLPANLTFTEAGYHTLPVIYSVGGITKTAYIVVKVADASNSNQLTGLAAAQTDAIAILTAYYNGMIFTAPANYPAAPEKLAKDAKSAFDDAIAAIQNASDAEAVYRLLGAAQAKLNSLDNYIDWYAAEKVSEMEMKFEIEYTNNKTFVKNYEDKFVVLKRQIARILRSDNLAEIDALVDNLDKELDDAENFLDDLIKQILKFDWRIDLPTDPEKDATDANLVLYYDIMASMEALGDTDLDPLYLLELTSRLSKVDEKVVEKLAPAGGIDQEYMDEVLAKNYNDRSKTYNLIMVFEEVSERIEELLEAREEADREGGIEDIIAKAIEGCEHGAIIANSERHEKLKEAKKAFDQWIIDYNIDEINEDLVANAKDLNQLLAILDKIVEVYENEEFNPDDYVIKDLQQQIILDNAAVKTALKSAEEINQKFSDKWQVPAWASIMVEGKQIYLVTNYDWYDAANQRYAALTEARTKAEAEGALLSQISAIKLPITYGTSNAAIDPAWTALQEMRVAYQLIATENYTLTCQAYPNGVAQTDATILANLEAILHGEYKVTWPLIDATTEETKNAYRYLELAHDRYATLTAAYNAASASDGIIAQINANIKTAELLKNGVTLDSKEMLDGITSAYEAWKSTYKIDPANDGKTILGDAYTIYKAGVDEYAALTAQLAKVKELIAAVKEPISELSAMKMNEARVAFNNLASNNSDATKNKSETYKHLEAQYQDLCRYEGELFAIRYASLLQSKYEGTLKALRDEYTGLIGGEKVRADANARLGSALSTALGRLHTLEKNTYTATVIAEEIYNNGASAAWDVPTNEKVEGVTYLYDIVVEATNKLIAEEENQFKIAAQYIVTVENNAYTLTIYAGNTYNAADILDNQGIALGRLENPITYKSIVIDALVGSDDVTLIGFTADEIVVSAACNLVLVDAADVQTKIEKIVVNAAASIDATESNAAIKVVATAAVDVNAKGDVTLNTTAAAKVETVGKADITTTADIIVKADTITAKVMLPKAEEGQEVQAPVINMTADGDINLDAAEGVNTDNVTSTNGTVNIQHVNFGEGDNGNEDEGWTEIH